VQMTTATVALVQREFFFAFSRVVSFSRPTAAFFFADLRADAICCGRF